MRYIKDSRICEELLSIKALINTNEEQVCNTVTKFLVTNKIGMDDIITITICIDGGPSMIGKKGFVS